MKAIEYVVPKERVVILPKITLVGAGPGDPDLISLKGVKALKTADVVIYDAMIDKELLAHAPVKATRVFVGDQSGDEQFSQQAVNQLLVDYAMNFGHVVRLKVGDLFVFGRGYDELEYAASYSIETAIVPGISSAISLPGLQGIPVTHQGVAESLWILRGENATGGLSEELAVAVNSKATVVVMLGYKRIADIVALYQQAGKGRLPVAVIQNGSMKNEKVAVGLVNTIVEVAAEEKISEQAPVLLVFGEAVSLTASFQPILHFLVDEYE